jgi:glycosyltransferase A (GT-A) superfamily protein (DUF2064 family)
MLVLFAKLPLRGRTKTRLVSSGCNEGLAYELSIAMLQDTLTNFSYQVSEGMGFIRLIDLIMDKGELFSRLVWYYAPHSMESEAQRMLELVDSKNQQWDLVPMPEREKLTSSSLGNLLIEAVNSLTSCTNL